MRFKTSFGCVLCALLILILPMHARGVEADWDHSVQEAEQLFRSGKYEQAIISAKRALDIATRNAGQDSLAVATSLNNLALIYNAQGKFEEAESLFEKGHAIAEKVLGQNHPALARFIKNRAQFYYRRGDFHQADPLYRRVLDIPPGDNRELTDARIDSMAALYCIEDNYADVNSGCDWSPEIVEKAMGSNHPAFATSLEKVAESHDIEGKLMDQRIFSKEGATSEKLKIESAEVEALYMRVIEIRERALGVEHPEVAKGLSGLANLYLSSENYAKAQPLFMRALMIREKALGPDHLEVAQSLDDLARNLTFQKDYDGAESLLLRALKVREMALGENHIFVAQSVTSLAHIYMYSENYAKAEPLLLRALAIRDAIGDDGVSEVQDLSFIYMQKGDYEKAEPLYKRELVHFERAFGRDSPNLVRLINKLAELCLRRGAYPEAELYYKRTLEIQEKALGPDHRDVSGSLENLARIYRDTKRDAEAIQLMGRAEKVRSAKP